MGSTVVVRAVARLVLVPSLVFAAALLVKSPSAVGDGFAAGVVAALALVVQYAVFGHEEVERTLHTRRLAAAVPLGLLLVLAVAFAPALAGEPLLSHHPRPGADVVHLGTLELTTALALDVGVALIVVGTVTGVLGRLAREERQS